GVGARARGGACGMRFGGGEITADMDKTDGATTTGADRTMSSAYFIMDITDPESPPEVLAEIRFDGLGYTTCYPVVVPMNDKDTSTGVINENEWYLVFGSGPASAGGKADINGSSTALDGAASSQTAKLFVLDLKQLVLNKQVITLDSSGTWTSAPTSSPGFHDYYQELDADSFISEPVSVDYNLDFNADAVYFGTVGVGSYGWEGKMRRIVIDNKLNPVDWDGDSELLSFTDTYLSKPVVAAPTVGMDNKNNRWIFFGTGRFYVRGDADSSETKSYYGIKESFTDIDPDGDAGPEEPDGYWDTDEEPTWETVTAIHSQLLDVTNAVIRDDKTVEKVKNIALSSDITT
ncbi:MAG: hypothetical protein MI684_04995, partial [Chlorobiales bacterium]|nr:hypothetical protein [Chlorobiales bacterium]